METRASRRQLLRMMMAGVASMAAAPQRAMAQSAGPTDFPQPATPDEAIKLLLDGNERYLSQKLNDCVVNFADLRHATEQNQKPFGCILTCADSRVPAEIVFDRSIGQLFVIRVAGNFAAPDTIASAEYAAEVLGVKAIVVMGHSGCGAVTAVLKGGTEPGQITEIYQYIYPATVGTTDLQTAVENNARLQATLMQKSSPVLAELVKNGKLSVVPAVYSLSTGKVTMLK